VLAAYALTENGGTRRELPRALGEISGMALSTDGRLFAHNDEVAGVSQIDWNTGAIVKTFSVGRPQLRADLEGMAIAGTRFFLTDSDGVIYEFQEGQGGQTVTYRQYATGLGERCEIEGFEYDARTQSLLFACKTIRDRSLRNRLVVFSYSLQRRALDPQPRISLTLDFLDEAGFKREIHPSGIAIHPRTGSYVLVAAIEELVVEIGRDGRPLGVRELPRKRHPQAEGIVFPPNGSMLISDERQSGGLLTLYPARPSSNRE
jgi:hypothetical protein